MLSIKICEVSLEMRKMGTKTPQICFATNSQSGRTMNELYDKFYAQEKYRTLWFYWDGKPLIMGNSKDPELRKDVEDFFTIKYSWAWSDSANYPNHWQWLDHYPQDTDGVFLRIFLSRLQFLQLSILQLLLVKVFTMGNNPK